MQQVATGYYVYGVVPADHPGAPSLRGIDDAEVEYVEHEDLAAAVAAVALERPPGRRAELMAHSAVLDALAAAGPVVPVQFGSVLEDVDSVVDDLLARHHDRFSRLLDRLRGTRQFTLRATYVQDVVLAEVVASRPDIAELRRRTRDLPEGAVHPDLVRLGELVSGALEAKRGDDVADLMEVVRSVALAEADRGGGGVAHLLDVALLVEDARVSELEARLETLAEAVHERIHLELRGPMAPFDFVEEDRWV